MEKMKYTTPETLTIHLQQCDAILYTVSGNNGTLLGDGGNTGDNNIITGDAKANNYNVWDDDWSR